MTTAVILALATGLPVVATRHSGFPDQVIPGKNGYLSNEADPKDFAEKMLQYMDHPELWGDMSEAARELALSRYDKNILIKKQFDCYRKFGDVKKVAFVVGTFPVISETFIIDQIGDLSDLGLDIEVYTFRDGSTESVSDRYSKDKMEEAVHSLAMPRNYLKRFVKAIPKFARILVANPLAALRTLNIFKYGSLAYSLQLVFWVEPFVGIDVDLVHCHFGTIANHYLTIKEVLGLRQPFVTTFYGYDISQITKQKGEHYYDRLKQESLQFFSMSENMKERMVKQGFDSSEIEVLPISVDVASFPFSRRELKDGEVIEILSVGRFVEKKGFDDLLKALAIVKEKSKRKFICHIIGGPKEKEIELRGLAGKLGVSDVVEWKGYVKKEEIVEYLMKMHLYVQASKTAANGDME